MEVGKRFEMQYKKNINIALFLILIIAIILDINYFPNIDSTKNENLKFLLLIPHTLIGFCVFLLLGLNATEFEKKAQKFYWYVVPLFPKTEENRIRVYQIFGFGLSVIFGLTILILIILWYVKG